MKNLKRLGGAAIALALAVVLAGPALANDITVGEFIQQIARAKSLNATDAKIAADSLAGVGIVLPSDIDFGAVLTEGAVASIARSAGLNVRTATPEAAFDRAKADRFLSSFDGELRTAKAETRERRYRKSDPGNGEGESEGPDGSGKGKGKGKNGRTPTEPA